MQWHCHNLCRKKHKKTDKVFETVSVFKYQFDKKNEPRYSKKSTFSPQQNPLDIGWCLAFLLPL